MRFGSQFGRQIVALSMLLTNQAHAEIGKQYPNVEETNRNAYSLLQVLSQCPNRIWPNLKMSSRDVLFVNNELDHQILVSPANKKISRVANKNLPAHVFTSTFSEIQIDGRDAIYVDSQFGKTTKSASASFELAVHEAFHMVDQADWIRKQGGARGTTIPMLDNPRIARNMLYRNLLKVYKDKSAESLSKARYWYDQWLQADPSEGLATTDGYEGTARYVDSIAKVLDARGCGVTEKEMENLVSQSEVMMAANSLGTRALDNEGYFIGSLAGFILRFQYPNSNWQEQVRNQKTPLEILLQDVNPTVEAVDPVIAEVIREAILEKQVAVEGYLKSTLAQLQKKNSIFVSIPYSTMQTSFSPKGFFSQRDGSVRYTPMAGNLEFKFKDSKSYARSFADAVFLDLKGASPCGGGWDFVVDASEIQSNTAEMYELKHPLVTGVFAAVVKKDAQNRTWICAQD